MAFKKMKKILEKVSSTVNFNYRPSLLGKDRDHGREENKRKFS